MNKTLTVSGMHCDACVALVKMEIEEAGVDPDKISIRVDGLNNKGLVSVRDLEDGEEGKVIEAINSMDSYQVE
jgi:copper chaperone CopZ